jgi:hypothetical protein
MSSNFAKIDVKVQLQAGTLLSINCSYVIPNPIRGRGKTYQIKTDWIVVNWTGSITPKQFASSFSSIVLKKMFCSLQSNQVRWMKLNITFGSADFFFQVPLSDLSGSLPDPPDNTLICSLMSSQKPRNRYSLQLRGVTNSVSINNRNPSNPSFFL